MTVQDVPARGSVTRRRAHRHARTGRDTKLTQALTDFAELSSQLGIEVAEVCGNIDALSSVVEEQAQLSTQLSATAEEIAAGNHQVAAAVEQTHRATETAHGQASGSREVLHEALGQLSEFVDWVGGTGEQLETVARALVAITEATRQIDRIAKQTHILALNARIEAARSGSAGQGFQVIADNVRELADQTIGAAKDIAATVAPLSGQIDELSNQGEQARAKAEVVRESTSSISTMIEKVTGALAAADEQVGEITSTTAAIGENVDAFLGSLSELASGLGNSSRELNGARERSDTMLTMSEKLVAASARTGVRTRDTRIIEIAVDAAARVSALFTEAIDRGQITMADLFDTDYRPIPGSDPIQHLTRFAEFTDRVLPAIQEPMVELDDRITFAICTDRNGYIPTHMKKVSQPQGSDPVWNAANCRNRRIFDDRTGLTCGRSTEPFVVQTYRRDMGGGRFVMMKDTSASIWVRGQHWGGFRIGYTA